jgi:hypothetical protein
MVQQVAEALPDAGTVLGAGWQQDLAKAWLLRWRVLRLLRRLCSSSKHACYDNAGTFMGMRRRFKCPGDSCVVGPKFLQYRGYAVTLAGLDH